jgi:hypothetical protein
VGFDTCAVLASKRESHLVCSAAVGAFANECLQESLIQLTFRDNEFTTPSCGRGVNEVTAASADHGLSARRDFSDRPASSPTFEGEIQASLHAQTRLHAQTLTSGVLGSSVQARTNLPQLKTFDPSTYPDGTQLWQSMRGHDGVATATSHETLRAGAGMSDFSDTTSFANQTTGGQGAAELGHDKVKGSDPAQDGLETQSLTLVSKLEMHAQWSLSALDDVFTHMTSSFMREVDFTRIDFDAIEQA